MKKKLFIFSNESISSNDGKFYCDNIDLKSTPEGLNKKFEVNSDLITEKGRLLQCSSCNHQWFFQKEILENIIETKNSNNARNPQIFSTQEDINEEVRDLKFKLNT